MTYTPKMIKRTLKKCINEMSAHPETFVKNPGKDFTRERKLPFYWMFRKMNKQEAEMFVDLMSDLEIKSRYIMMCFDQETLELFRPKTKKNTEYYRKCRLALFQYRVEHGRLFHLTLISDE